MGASRFCATDYSPMLRKGRRLDEWVGTGDDEDDDTPVGWKDKRAKRKRKSEGVGCTGHLVGPRRHRVPNNDKSRKFEIDTPSHPGPDLPLMSCFAFQLNLDGPVHRSLNNVCITCKMFLGFCWQESAKFCLISVVFLVVFFLYNFFFPNSQLRAPLPRSCSILAASRGPGYTSGGYCIFGISIHCLVLARVGRLLRKVVFKAAGRTNEWSPMAQKSTPLFANQQLLST